MFYITFTKCLTGNTCFQVFDSIVIQFLSNSNPILSYWQFNRLISKSVWFLFIVLFLNLGVWWWRWWRWWWWWWCGTDWQCWWSWGKVLVFFQIPSRNKQQLPHPPPPDWAMGTMRSHNGTRSTSKCSLLQMGYQEHISSSMNLSAKLFFHCQMEKGVRDWFLTPWGQQRHRIGP